MINIRKKKKRSVPGLNMAAMPDLIFTVLFFFMIATHMRKEDVQVKYEIPAGTEVSQASKKYASLNIYVGKDAHDNIRIQVGDKVMMLHQVGNAVQSFRSHLPSQEDADAMTINIRADKSVPMGVISDIKTELRKAGALTIRYSANQDKQEN